MSVKKAGKTGRTKPLIVVAPAVAASPSSDTPETDALAGEWIACECVPVSHSRKLERERDEARLLCRWAFPRLRAMCHDFDATGTGWCCAEEMESHPEIFSSENFGAHTRREQPLNTTMPNDKQTTSESPPCDAASSPECAQCHHWEYDDGRHGFMSGYCPIFQKVTHREHGAQCTAWTRIHLENQEISDD